MNLPFHLNDKRISINCVNLKHQLRAHIPTIIRQNKIPRLYEHFRLDSSMAMEQSIVIYQKIQTPVLTPSSESEYKLCQQRNRRVIENEDVSSGKKGAVPISHETGLFQ